MRVVYPETPSPENILASKNAEVAFYKIALDMSVNGEYPKSYSNYLNKKGWYRMEPGDQGFTKLQALISNWY